MLQFVNAAFGSDQGSVSVQENTQLSHKICCESDFSALLIRKRSTYLQIVFYPELCQQSWLSGRAQNSLAVNQSSRLKQH